MTAAALRERSDGGRRLTGVATGVLFGAVAAVTGSTVAAVTMNPKAQTKRVTRTAIRFRTSRPLEEARDQITMALGHGLALQLE